MKLSQVLAPQVSPSSRSRGYSYFTSGAVRSLTTEHGIVQATVRGSDTYTVWLEPGDALLRASCNCPYFVDRVDICKHVWAVILAAEAQSVPLLTSGGAAEDVDLEPVYPDGIDDFDDDVDLWPQVKPAAPPHASSRRPAASPPWRQLLDSLGSTPAPAPLSLARLASSQLLYVIDAAASATSGALILELMTRDRKANGEWGKPRLARLTPADVRSTSGSGASGPAGCRSTCSTPTWTRIIPTTEPC